MNDQNDRTAATPNEAPQTIPDDDRWKLPPLANAVTGVVRLRNGEEVPVRRQGDEVREVAETRSRSWPRTGEWLYNGRHPNDIVAQVSVGPTGPGVYETVDGGSCDIIGRDEGGWYVANRLLRRDDFGRCFNRSRSIRVATGDLRRRIGDLPEAEPLPAEVQDFAAAVERATEAAKSAEPYREACERLLGVAKRVVLSDGREGVVFAHEDLPPLLVALAEAAGKRDEPVHAGARPVAEPAASVESIPVGTGHADYRCRNGKVRHLHGRSDMGFHLSYAVPDGDDDGKPHEYLPDGRERAGNREWDIVGVAPQPDVRRNTYRHAPRLDYSAADGRAAMDAMWGDGVPTVDQRTRDWLREMVREFVAADVITNQKGIVITASPERFALCEADLVPVSRDDLRVLFERAWSAAELDHVLGEAQGYVIAEAVSRALSRAAAALGETLPEWMREHAKREGWTEPKGTDA